jgi:hypothetical protein
MYALFRGTTRIAGTFPTWHECLKSALAEGLISEAQMNEIQVANESGAQTPPTNYHIDQIQESYDPQPDWKLPREIS